MASQSNKTRRWVPGFRFTSKNLEANMAYPPNFFDNLNESNVATEAEDSNNAEVIVKAKSSRLARSSDHPRDDAYGGHFNSPIFTLEVGKAPFTTKFLVHEAVQSRSPVFAAMCKPPFREAEDKCIRLPEEHVGPIGRLVGYLYTSKYSVNVDAAPTNVMDLWGQAYILGEKYQLDELKAHVMDMLTPRWRRGETAGSGPAPTGRLVAGLPTAVPGSTVPVTTAYAEAFFGMVQDLYKTFPEPGEAFRNFFKKAALIYMWCGSHEMLREKIGTLTTSDATDAALVETERMICFLGDLAHEGGHFATDCVMLSSEYSPKMDELDRSWLNHLDQESGKSTT